MPSFSGRVYDLNTGSALPDISVIEKKSGKIVITAFDGSFNMPIAGGYYSFSFEGKGYQRVDTLKAYIDFSFERNWTIYLADSSVAGKRNSFSRLPLMGQTRFAAFNALLPTDANVTASVTPGTSMELSPFTGKLLLGGSDGINGRYNVVQVNGVVMPMMLEQDWQNGLSIFPSSAIKETELQKFNDGSVHGLISGSSFAVALKDIPADNHILVSISGMYLSESTGKSFSGVPLHKMEYAGVADSKRSFPADFPSTIKRYPLKDLNPQVQVDHLKSLPADLRDAPRNARPGHDFTVEWARRKGWKDGKTGGFTFTLNQSSRESIQDGVAQASVNAFSTDRHYASNGQWTALMSAAIKFRGNKLSLMALYNNAILTTNTDRSDILKPDEDSLANQAIVSRSIRNRNMGIQLHGEHSFKGKNVLQFDWSAMYLDQLSDRPDQKSLLLREELSGNERFSLAVPQVAPIIDRDNVGSAQLESNLQAIFTNSGRLFNTSKDKVLIGMANLSYPLSVFGKKAQLKGGLQVRGNYFESYSDLLLYSGGGFTQKAQLLDPARYYPGGLSVIEFYSKQVGPTGFFAPSDIHSDNLGNFSGSSNIGAAFLQIQMPVVKALNLEAGIRLETSSQLTNSIEYQYFENFRSANRIALNQNIYINRTDFLPHLRLGYRFLNKLTGSAAYFRSLIRPTNRELSSYASYDPIGFTVENGNPLLDASLVDNVTANLQYELPDAGFFQVGIFYKKLYQPLEYLVDPYANSIGTLSKAAFNMPEAVVYGLNGSLFIRIFPRQTNWLNGFHFSASASFNYSQVDSGVIKKAATRPLRAHRLSGIAPFSYQLVLQYAWRRLPTLMASYSVQGDRLYAVGREYDYLMKGMPLLSLQVRQKLLKSRLAIGIGVSNLLAADYVIFQDLNGNRKYDTGLTIERIGNSGGRILSGEDLDQIKIAGQVQLFANLSYSF